MIFGIARSGFEKKMYREMVAANLLEKPLEISQNEKVGQTFSAVALGGLRTVVASFLNLRAYGFFERQEWRELAEAYETITSLQPRSLYYWDSGQWHLTYNAAGQTRNNAELTPLRREQLFRHYIKEGREFGERGLKNMPDSYRLHQSLAQNYSNVHRLPDFEKAANHYKRAWQLNPQSLLMKRQWLLCLASTTGNDAEILTNCREMYHHEKTTAPFIVTPALACLTFAMESIQPGALPTIELVDAIFPDRITAWKQLSLYYQNNANQRPTHGIPRALELLQHNVEK